MKGENKMAVLQCDICGGKLKMSSGEVAVCESCGMEHTKERVQEKVQEIKGIVQVEGSVQVEGVQTLEKALENGETFLKLCEFESARKAFDEITKKYTSCSSGWWGLLKAETNNFTNDSIPLKLFDYAFTLSSAFDEKLFYYEEMYKHTNSVYKKTKEKHLLEIEGLVKAEKKVMENGFDHLNRGYNKYKKRRSKRIAIGLSLMGLCVLNFFSPNWFLLLTIPGAYFGFAILGSATQTGENGSGGVFINKNQKNSSEQREKTNLALSIKEAKERLKNVEYQFEELLNEINSKYTSNVKEDLHYETM